MIRLCVWFKNFHSAPKQSWTSWQEASTKKNGCYKVFFQVTSFSKLTKVSNLTKQLKCLTGAYPWKLFNSTQMKCISFWHKQLIQPNFTHWICSHIESESRPLKSVILCVNDSIPLMNCTWIYENWTITSRKNGIHPKHTTEIQYEICIIFSFFFANILLNVKFSSISIITSSDEFTGKKKSK